MQRIFQFLWGGDQWSLKCKPECANFFFSLIKIKNFNDYKNKKKEMNFNDFSVGFKWPQINTKTKWKER